MLLRAVPAMHACALALTLQLFLTASKQTIDSFKALCEAWRPVYAIKCQYDSAACNKDRDALEVQHGARRFDELLQAAEERCRGKEAA